MRLLRSVCLLELLVLVASAGAQAALREDDIPKDMARDVKEEVRGLYALNPETRGHAAYALRKLGSRAAPAVPFLVAMLGDGAQLKAEYLRESELVSEKRTFKMERLETTSPGRLAAETLGTIGRPGLGLLHKALKDPDKLVREHAALALGGLKDKTSTAALLPLLGDEKHEVRKRVVQALGRIGDPAAFEGLAHTLKSDDNLHVRLQAAWALGQLRDPRCIGPLMEALGDARLVSSEAEKALGEFRGPQVVDLAIKTLKHDSLRARVVAAQILRANEDRRAVPALIAALGDQIQVQSQALLALEAISGKPGAIGPVAADWQHWWELEEAGREIEGPVVARDADALARLLRTHTNWAVRVRAARALSQFQGDLVLDTLVDAMWDANLDVRLAAVWAVGALRSPRGIEALLGILDSTVPILRDEAHQALLKITGERVMKPDRQDWLRWWHANKNRLYKEYMSRSARDSSAAAEPQADTGSDLALYPEDPDAPGGTPTGEDGRGADAALMVIGGLIVFSVVALLAVQAIRKPKRRKGRKRRKR